MKKIEGKAWRNFFLKKKIIVQTITHSRRFKKVYRMYLLMCEKDEFGKAWKKKSDVWQMWWYSLRQEGNGG